MGKVHGSQMEPIRSYAESPFVTGISADGKEFFVNYAKGMIRSPIDTFRYRERTPFPWFANARVIQPRVGGPLVVIGPHADGGAATRIVLVELD
jgi:hypothetical protein